MVRNQFERPNCATTLQRFRATGKIDKPWWYVKQTLPTVTSDKHARPSDLITAGDIFLKQSKRPQKAIDCYEKAYARGCRSMHLLNNLAKAMRLRLTEHPRQDRAFLAKTIAIHQEAYRLTRSPEMKHHLVTLYTKPHAPAEEAVNFAIQLVRNGDMMRDAQQMLHSRFGHYEPAGCPGLTGQMQTLRWVPGKQLRQLSPQLKKEMLRSMEVLADSDVLYYQGKRQLLEDLTILAADADIVALKQTDAVFKNTSPSAAYWREKLTHYIQS